MNRHTIVIYLPSRGVERQRRGHARHSKGVAQAALATAPVPGRPSAAVLVTAVAASAIGSALGGEGWRRAGGGGGALHWLSPVPEAVARDAAKTPLARVLGAKIQNVRPPIVIGPRRRLKLE